MKILGDFASYMAIAKGKRSVKITEGNLSQVLTCFVTVMLLGAGSCGWKEGAVGL